MAIRHWSGRRLVGTWAAGAVAECVVIAAPILFLVIVGAGTSLSPAEERAVINGEWRQASADVRRADARRRVNRVDERLKSAEAELSAPVAPMPVAIEQRAVGLGRSEVIEAHEAVEAHWYNVPLAGALVLYLFAIPVGLLVVTAVWLITRLDRSPPPSTT